MSLESQGIGQYRITPCVRYGVAGYRLYCGGKRAIRLVLYNLSTSNIRDSEFINEKMTEIKGDDTMKEIMLVQAPMRIRRRNFEEVLGRPLWILPSEDIARVLKEDIEIEGNRGSTY